MADWLTSKKRGEVGQNGDDDWNVIHCFPLAQLIIDEERRLLINTLCVKNKTITRLVRLKSKKDFYEP